MPLCRLCFIKIKILHFLRKFTQRIPVTGYRPDNRIIHHLLAVIVQVMIHADLQERQQTKAHFPDQLPSFFVKYFFDLLQIALERVLVFQLKCR